ncbi:MAG: aldo/keto reductase [Candidatus Riflebacteria bacterium]|nr:aldo/keto reductase [Candidatus Riflebacteria bacterium]
MRRHLQNEEHRTFESVTQSIDESLKAFQTGYIDVMLFHEINYPDDPAWIFERVE